MIESISNAEINKALEGTTRQYLVGNLARPQALEYFPNVDLEIGITRYESESVEPPHFHDEATEFQYMISGWTRYRDLDTGKEFDFKAGDFFVIKPDTKYVQKSKRGTEILFIKLPSINDKHLIEISPQIEIWMKEQLKTLRRDYFEDPKAPEANSIRPAAAVAVCEDDRLLMVQRADSGNWTLPGGTLDFGESLPNCAVREMQEETGLQVEITDVLGTYTNPEVKIEYSDGEVRQECTVVFLGKSANTNVEIDHESISYAWVPFSELMSTGMADSQRRRISDLLHFFSTGEKRIS